MENLVLAVHYIVCTFLIVSILLQAGKGADIGAVFGGSSQTVFGSRGATTFLTKMTTVLALVFLLTSITLASFSRARSRSSILNSVSGGKSSPALPVELEKPAEPSLVPEATPTVAPAPPPEK